MDDVQCISYRDTGYFSSLICDYLDQKPELAHLYNRFPVIENFREQIKERSGFSRELREKLVLRLKAQYDRLQPTETDDQRAFHHINLLEEEKTYTITTGHQLNLFTGPLYFFYKIVSVVNLCKELKKKYPDNNFVPVHWMAAEDHDFAEINHINIAGGRLLWEREAGGPVGRLDTASMETVLERLKELTGKSTHGRELVQLFRKAYLEHGNLADATRYMVHHFFAEEGLVIVDGDDSQLKSLMVPFFKQELLEEVTLGEVEGTTQWLTEHYFEQVHPRNINLFYIKDGLRERIDRQGKTWGVLNTGITWTREELLKELEEYPERFSPNAILRPLYQETILPNLAYIGGGGELAYWFQLKQLFDKVEVPFPMLVLRNSALIYTQRQQEKLQKMGLQVKDLFQPLHQLKSRIAAESAPIDPKMEPYQAKLQKMFDELEEVAHLTDKSMLGAVNAQRQKQLNGLDKLRKKLIRAEKRKNSDKMERLEQLYLELFPKQSLQERHDNFIPYYEEYGEKWLQKLLYDLDPLDFRFALLRF
ncbi:MAG: bacillithiol biosynthesis cysteine-adding enzyme BshC [Owenweeksia sp.]|nr:bacillithiol biosynthesis cysteine-adding enzyme BshC [Owenweeksia sp.]